MFISCCISSLPAGALLVLAGISRVRLVAQLLAEKLELAARAAAVSEKFRTKVIHASQRTLRICHLYSVALLVNAQSQIAHGLVKQVSLKGAESRRSAVGSRMFNCVSNSVFAGRTKGKLKSKASLNSHGLSIN